MKTVNPISIAFFILSTAMSFMLPLPCSCIFQPNTDNVTFKHTNYHKPDEEQNTKRLPPIAQKGNAN